MMALTGLGFQILKPKESIEKETRNGEPSNDSEIKITMNQDYNKIINIDVYEMEFKPHPTNVFRVWRITTAIWLKRYVRDRFIYYNPEKTFFFAFAI